VPELPSSSVASAFLDGHLKWLFVDNELFLRRARSS